MTGEIAAAARSVGEAARRCAAAGRADEARAHLAAARGLPELAPEMQAQIEAAAKKLAPEVPVAAAGAEAAPAIPARGAPVSASEPTSAAGAVRILACKLVRLAEDALHVELSSGKTRRVEFNRLVGVKAGVVPTPNGASIVTDFVLSWGDGAQGPSAIRIPGPQLGLASHFPGVPSKEAYSRLLAHVLARTAGDEALARGDYPRFASVAALNAAFYGGAQG